MDCIKCRNNIETEDVIYIRSKVKGKWDEYPICDKCWFIINPNIKPVRVIRNE